MSDEFLRRSRRLAKKNEQRPPCESKKVCVPCLAAFVARQERRRIRRALAPALRELLAAIGEQDRTGTPHQTWRLYGYADAIDRATKAPKRKATKGGTTP